MQLQKNEVYNMEDKRIFKIPNNNAFIKGMLTFCEIFNKGKYFVFSTYINAISHKFVSSNHIISTTNNISDLLFTTIDTIDKSRSTSLKTKYFSVLSFMGAQCADCVNVKYIILRSSTLSFVSGFLSMCSQIHGFELCGDLMYIIKDGLKYDTEKIYYNLDDQKLEYTSKVCHHYNVCYTYYRKMDESYIKSCSTDINCNVKIKLGDTLTGDTLNKDRHVMLLDAYYNSTRD